MNQKLRPIVGPALLFFFCLFHLPCLGGNMTADVPKGLEDGSKKLHVFIQKATIHENSRLAPFVEGRCVVTVKNIDKAEISLSAYASRDSDHLEWMENPDFSSSRRSAEGIWMFSAAAPGSYFAHDRKFTLAPGASEAINLRFAIDSSQVKWPFRIDFFVSVVGQKRKLFVRSQEFHFK